MGWLSDDRWWWDLSLMMSNRLLEVEVVAEANEERVELLGCWVRLWCGCCESSELLERVAEERVLGGDGDEDEEEEEVEEKRSGEKEEKEEGEGGLLLVFFFFGQSLTMLKKVKKKGLLVIWSGRSLGEKGIRK